MVASNRLSGNHDSHAIPMPGADQKVLRVGILYGANGAGKSNLFKAIKYLRTIALRWRGKEKSTGRGGVSARRNYQRSFRIRHSIHSG